MDARLETEARELRAQKADLVAYLLSKVRSGDWHAIQDAASDIREIDAQLELLGKMNV